MGGEAEELRDEIVAERVLAQLEERRGELVADATELGALGVAPGVGPVYH